MADIPNRRPRRQFTDEFKATIVRLVLDDVEDRRCARLNQSCRAAGLSTAIADSLFGVHLVATQRQDGITVS
jgi:hypothetical protein